MVELIGDICEPSHLVIPSHTTDTKSGAMFISGCMLSILSGGAVWTVNVTEL